MSYMIFLLFQMMLSAKTCTMNTLSIIFLFAMSIYSVHSIAVMSVDLGTEWMKVAIVSVSIKILRFV